MDTVSVKERQEQLETATAEMIDTIENYFNASPFELIEGFDASPGEYTFDDYKAKFHCFQPWAEHWMELIDPRMYAERPEDIPEFVFLVQRFGFFLGVLTGMKSMGATREELTKKAHGLIQPIIRHEGFVAR